MNGDQEVRESAIRQEMAGIASSALIGAALMLFAGFGLNLRGGTGNPEAYNFALAAFTLTMKTGGIAMLISALLLYIGWTPWLILDALIAAIIGIVLVGSGIVLMRYGDWQGILNMVFGALFLGSAKRSWMLHSASPNVGVAWSGEQVADGPASTGSRAPGDDQSRQAAMDRLIASKRREGAELAAAAPAAAKPVAAVKQAAPPAVVPVKKEPKVEEPPPPDGFLAQLGRDDDA